MRPLVLAGIAAALAGCSLNYEGKVFKASEHPNSQSATVQTGGRAEYGEKQIGIAMRMYNPDADLATPVATSAVMHPSFPVTAQPTGRKPDIQPLPPYAEQGPVENRGEEEHEGGEHGGTEHAAHEGHE